MASGLSSSRSGQAALPGCGAAPDMQRWLTNRPIDQSTD